MEEEYTDIESQVYYGLDSIDDEKMVEVPLKDLMLLYKAIGEQRRFFHQPLHYPKLEDVEKFLGDREKGMYSIINNIYCDVFDRILPVEVMDDIMDEVYSNPKYPYYYKVQK
jgi:hypothetical protein